MKTRFAAPPRAEIDPAVFARPPLAHWSEFDELLRGPEWPGIAALAARATCVPGAPRFVAQTPALLRDGLHYEDRIAVRGEIATRECNWHDLLNALVWLRYPVLKRALNARQTAEIAAMGPKRRSRAQCALTHFDEAGVVVVLRDYDLLAPWDAHEWTRLFRDDAAAWLDGRIDVAVFGHALLEHALKPHQLVVGKAIVVLAPPGADLDAAIDRVARSVGAGEILLDPQELRPLPLSGIPGWHADSTAPDFYESAPCFRPLRTGRRYPPALRL
ncbi:MAG TPA: DUF3025 domain-containing protein [Rudaea sp.]|nr:DUF3025 domain-containing protein [Rudaea sp.]